MPLKAEAAIQLVGTTTASGTTTAYNMSLTALKGGIGSAPIAGDIVIVLNTNATTTADGNPGVGTAGFIEMADIYNAVDTNRTNFSVSYKIMTASPDSLVSCNGSTSSVTSSVCAALVFRGVNPTNPMDTASTTAKSAINTTEDPDCPSIQPVTAGAVTVCTGGSAGTSLDSVVVGYPATFTPGVQSTSPTDPGLVASALAAFKTWSGSNAEDPAAMTLDLGTATANTWVALTMVLHPITAPNAPTIGAATAGNGQASVAFTPPADDGGSAITGYTVTSTPDSKTGTGSASPITVTGLTNGTAYTFTVHATNVIGDSAESAASNPSVTPATIPTVTTSVTVDSITAISATLNGEITVTGGANATARGFATSTSNTLSSAVATTTDTVGQPFGTGTFTGAVTGLVCNTLYYFRAYATNSVGTGFGTIPTPFTTSSCNVAPTLSISQPPSGNAAVAEGSSYTITYALADSDNVVTAAFYYDTNNTGLDGVAITGACATAAEDPTVTCSFDTSVLTPGTPYYIYGITNDGTNPQVSAYSAGTITVNDAPTLSISEPNGTSDTVIVGASYDITYALADSDNVVTAAFYYDTNNSGLDGVAITGACATAAEDPTVTCSWDTTGMTTGSYYVYGITNDGTNSQVSAYSSGQITINPVPIYSISISPAGNIEYGYVALSVASSTVGSTYTKTALNNSSTGTTEKISVKSSNATNGTGWTLASTIGANQFKHEFSTTTGSRWDVMPDSTTYVTAKPSVAVDGTVAFDFRLTVPSSSDYVQKSITITVLAEVP